MAINTTDGKLLREKKVSPCTLLSDYVHSNLTQTKSFIGRITQPCTYKAVQNTTLKDSSMGTYCVLTTFRDRGSHIASILSVLKLDCVEDKRHRNCHHMKKWRQCLKQVCFSVRDPTAGVTQVHFCYRQYCICSCVSCRSPEQNNEVPPALLQDLDLQQL